MAQSLGDKRWSISASLKLKERILPPLSTPNSLPIWDGRVMGAAGRECLRFLRPGIYHACVCAKSLSRVWFLATPWAIALQAPLSMEFSREEYLSGLPFLSPGELPNQGVEPASLKSPELASGFFTTSATWYSAKWAFLVALVVKNPPTTQETRVPSLDQEDPLEEHMYTHGWFVWKYGKNHHNIVK